jgi:hypothetical protein
MRSSSCWSAVLRLFLRWSWSRRAVLSSALRFPSPCQRGSGGGSSGVSVTRGDQNGEGGEHRDGGHLRAPLIAQEPLPDWVVGRCDA